MEKDKNLNKTVNKGKKITKMASVLALGVTLQSAIPLTVLADELNKTESTSVPVSSETVSSIAETPISEPVIPVVTEQTPETTVASEEKTTESTTAESQSTETKNTESNVETNVTETTTESSEKPATAPTVNSDSEKVVTDKESSTEDSKTTDSEQDKEKETEKDKDKDKDKDKEQDKDKDKDVENLAENKKLAVESFTGNKYLSTEDHNNLVKEISQAKNNSEVNQLKEKYSQLASETQEKVVQAKSNALADLDSLKALTDGQKAEFYSKITGSYSESEIKDYISQAKSLDLQNKINNQKQAEAEQKAKEEAQKAEEARKQQEQQQAVVPTPSYNWGTSNSDNNFVSGNSVWGSGETHYSKNQTTQAFIEKIGEDARELCLKNDVYASVMIAQAILESGSGNSALASEPNYNLFGVKGSYKGQSVNFSTGEDNGSGGIYTIRSDFRKYPSYKESMEDYIKLIKEGIQGNKDFYKPTWKSQTKSYEDATKYLQGKYATDTSYASKLNGLIKTYDLDQYDREKPDMKEIEKIAGRNDLSTQTKIEEISKTQLGVPYVFGGNTPGVGLDCSSFVQFVFSKVGISLPRTAQAQYDASARIPKEAIQKGDLIFFHSTYATSDYITHVGIYLGDGKYIQEGGANVHITDLNESYTQAHLAGFGRVTK